MDPHDPVFQAAAETVNDLRRHADELDSGLTAEDWAKICERAAQSFDDLLERIVFDS